MNDQIKQLVAKASVMQLATTVDDKPWICNLYFVTDDELNFYWLSYQSRRHSQDIVKNPQAAINVAIKLDQPVIGLQAEGVVSQVDDPAIVKSVMKTYVDVHQVGQQFYDNFINKTAKHSLYVLKPSLITVFDELNNPKNPQNKLYLS